MDFLQFCLHGQPADVCLQVRAVHHADAKHYEGDVLGLGAYQAAASPAYPQRLVGRGGFLLLILEDDFTEQVRGEASTFYSRVWSIRHEEKKKRFSELNVFTLEL